MYGVEEKYVEHSGRLLTPEGQVSKSDMADMLQ